MNEAYNFKSFKDLNDFEIRQKLTVVNLESLIGFILTCNDEDLVNKIIRNLDPELKDKIRKMGKDTRI